jgi:hypothetical protein
MGHNLPRIYDGRVAPLPHFGQPRMRGYFFLFSGQTGINTNGIVRGRPKRPRIKLIFEVIGWSIAQKDKVIAVLFPKTDNLIQSLNTYKNLYAACFHFQKTEGHMHPWSRRYTVPLPVSVPPGYNHSPLNYTIA